MGEGKTRVIVPMLVLCWARPGGAGTLVRLHFLWALLPEVYDFLHEHLTGGLLATKLFLFPFNRDVELTPERAFCLAAQAARCQAERSAALVTPESRCSMQLKALELRAAGRVGEAAALAAFEAAAWRDVHDESDEILVRLRLLGE